TPPQTRWTKSSRKNWRKIPPSSQSLVMRLRIWNNRCLVDKQGGLLPNQLCVKLRNSFKAKLAALRPRLRRNRHGPASTKYVSNMLSRVFTSGPTGSAECQVLSATANAYPVLGEKGICAFFGFLLFGSTS